MNQLDKIYLNIIINIVIEMMTIFHNIEFHPIEMILSKKVSIFTFTFFFSTLRSITIA